MNNDNIKQEIQATYSNVKLIFIIPFRNREAHLSLFSRFMPYILEDYKKDEIIFFICNQQDDRPFNRGAMKNLGFIISQQLFPTKYKDITFVFNDIDTMPSKKDMISYETTSNIVKHFYGFKFALGGIFSIQGRNFEQIGGFPNIWGWGYEDNIIQSRVLNHNLNINYDQFYPISHPSMLSVNHGFHRQIDQKIVFKTKAFHDTSFYKDIKNIEYSIRPLSSDSSFYYIDFKHWVIPQDHKDIILKIEKPKPRLEQFKFDMKTIVNKQKESRVRRNPQLYKGRRYR